MIIQQRNDLLAPGPEEVYSVSSLYENRVIGVCTGVRKRWYGERHRIELVQVVVKDGFHRRGIARYMMKEIAKHFSKYSIEIIQISVEDANENAVSAYMKIGFVRFGTLEKGLKYENKYSDEVLLSMKIEDLLGN
ncbi:MAG: GNAT family N-acetyltransferase [Candidatus Thorarchaeota archaeon]